MIDAYSVPCAPASSASTGPGRAPLTTMTGIDSAASLPAATSMAPTAICPGAAVAVPTVKGACAAATRGLPQNASVTSNPVTTRVYVMGPSTVLHGSSDRPDYTRSRGQDDDCTHRLIGTSRFSSSNQCLTTTTVGGSPAAVSSRIIRNRCPSGATS